MWKPFIRVSHWVEALHLGIFLEWDRNLRFELGIDLFRWVFAIGFKSPELVE